MGQTDCFPFISNETPCGPAVASVATSQRLAVGPVMLITWYTPAARPCQVLTQRRWDLVRIGD